MAFIIRELLYRPFYNLLIFFAEAVPGHSLGWAIIALTLLIRILLLPSSLRAARAQAKLQALQPKINAIRRKHKDQMEQSKALMELYKEEGVSQFGACLPMLIQFPILIVLYRVFRDSLGTSGYALLYPFINPPESISHFFFGLDLSKPELWVLPILAGLSQYVLSYLTMPKNISSESQNQDPTQMMMKQMNFILPLSTFFFARIMPAAVALYWVVTTVFGAVQQWYVNKEIKPKFMAEISHLPEIASPKQDEVPEKKKKDYLSKVMDRRLTKSEKKVGVDITIRRKDNK